MPDRMDARLDMLRHASPYFAALCDADPAIAASPAPLDRMAPLPSAQDAPVDAGMDLAGCQDVLRAAKRAGLVRVIWWELGLRGDIARSSRHLADWADGLLASALAMAGRLSAERYGDIAGGRFCVVGLGKLGGRELNLGSDVDLLFVWDAPADARSDGRRSVSAGEYFQHLSRLLIRLMGERTAGGECWKTDMRLRPGGDGAPICLNLDATLSHYQEYGQTWERAMLVKARGVAGDRDLGERFIDGVIPFVYKRYLDFTTVQALAEMKRRIDAQAGSRPIGPGFDVKRGLGGIREVEFVVQSMQLLRGGREPNLRTANTVGAIAALKDAGHLSDADASMLTDAYWCWRRIEHAVQARLGEHTHRLPEGFEGYLAGVLDLQDPLAVMQGQADAVHALFAAQFATESAPAFSWLHAPASELAPRLSGFDADARARIIQALARMAEQLRRGLLPERSHGEVDVILNHAMAAWARDANGAQAVELFAELLASIAGRATWVDLLAGNPGVRGWLVSVLSASRYIAAHVAADPSWLEWPLGDGKGAVRMVRLLAGLAAIDAGRLTDDEALADLGRLVDQCRLTAAMAVADKPAADAATVGAWLADTADAAVTAAMAIAARQLGLAPDFPLVALAMGKHGSREMGLVSDLDMVFVLAADDPDAIVPEGGPKGKNLREWAQRLGRRIIQHLTMASPYGAGYAFDARLRPSGASGVLVTTLTGFADYQRHEAESWEHQALTRARAVAGPMEARAQVMAAVDAVLAMPRDRKRLAADVVAMREKMQQHLASREPGIINLKHDAGGLVDIEFLAQYARLAFGGRDTGMMAILRHLPEAAPAAWHDRAGFLAETFADYRQMENALRVQLWASVARLPADDAAPAWESLRRHAPIRNVAALTARMHKVRGIFDALLRTPRGA